MSASAVVLVSGGMDSCVTATIAACEHDRVAFLHATYGQRTAARERRAFEEITERLGAAHHMVLDLSHLAAMGGSALTDAGAELERYDENKTGTEIPMSYVPFRNANMLAAATAWAEVLGAGAVYIGAVQTDYSGYPDCRREFLDAFERAIELGTRPDTRIRIESPLIDLSKAQIIAKGTELEAPLELTWSCYQREDLACGVCESCGLRLKGFAEAGFTDPIGYVKT